MKVRIAIRMLRRACIVLHMLVFGVAAAGASPSGGPTTAVDHEATEFLRLVAPYRLDELEALRTSAPDEYRQRVVNLADRKRQLDDLRRADPARYKLRLDELTMEQQSQYLGEQYRKAKSPEERERLKSELASLLDKLFDVRGQSKAADVRDLEMEIDRLKKALADRQKNKTEMVKARLEELLGERMTPEW